MRIETPRQQGLRLLRMQNVGKKGGSFFHLYAMRVSPGSTDTVVCTASNPSNEQAQGITLGFVAAPHAVDPMSIMRVYYYKVDRNGLATGEGSVPLGEYAAGDMISATVNPGYALVAEYQVTWANAAFTPRWEIFNAPVPGANVVSIEVPSAPAPAPMLGYPPPVIGGAPGAPVIRPVI